jgi:hypothetical protein
MCVKLVSSTASPESKTLKNLNFHNQIEIRFKNWPSLKVLKYTKKLIAKISREHDQFILNWQIIIIIIIIIIYFNSLSLTKTFYIGND